MDRKYREKMFQTYLNNTVIKIANKISESVYRNELTEAEGDNLLTEKVMKQMLYRHYKASYKLGRFWVTDKVLLEVSDTKDFNDEEIESMINEAVQIDFNEVIEVLREILS